MGLSPQYNTNPLCTGAKAESGKQNAERRKHKVYSRLSFTGKPKRKS
jgi:hypothetical protein